MRTIEYPKTQAEIDANLWDEITEERYWWLLECLPPANMGKGVFQVGETLCHMDDERVVYQTCAKVNGKYWSKPWPGDAFDVKAIVREIRKQIGGGK